MFKWANPHSYIELGNQQQGSGAMEFRDDVTRPAPSQWLEGNDSQGGR
jgi:hypothetical protein